MKIITLLLFIFCTSPFPDIKSNTTEKEKSESVIYSLFAGKKTFLLAYSTESYWWSDKKDYQVLAFNENKWEIINVSLQRNKRREWSEPRISYKSINFNRANNLISQLTEISFWDLQRETLNESKVENEDGTISKYSISDGINYKVEILDENKYRIIEAYEPEYFLSHMPNIKEREIFIRSMNKIESIFKK